MLLLTLGLAGLVCSLIIVPPPIGPYGVSLVDLQLIDTSRNDPYSGAPNRTIPMSLVTPTGPFAECQAIQQMYMPYTTAEFLEQSLGAETGLSLNNTFSQLVLSICAPEHKPSHNEYPLIFFSPGSGTNRQLYHVICTNIAAQGYTVITVDAPGEPGSFTTYLDETVQYGSNATLTPEVLVNNRVLDFEFIIDQLSRREPLHGNHNLNMSRPIIFGHSLGGDTALSLIFDDARVNGGANLDGGIDGSPLNHTTGSPVLIFASDMPGALQHNQSSVRGWAQTWVDLLGPKWQLQMLGSAHDTFTDVPVLVDLFGLRSAPGIENVLGSITSGDALNITVSVLSSLAAYLSGRVDVQSIIDLAETFSEVVVVNASHIGL